MKETRHIPHHHPIRLPLTRWLHRARAYASFREYYLVTKARCHSARIWHQSPHRPSCVLALARRRRKLRAARARYLARQAQLLIAKYTPHQQLPTSGCTIIPPLLNPQP